MKCSCLCVLVVLNVGSIQIHVSSICYMCTLDNVSTLSAELMLHKVVVHAPPPQQLTVRPGLDNLAAVQHSNAV